MTCRHLWGENIDLFEVSVPIGQKHAHAKVLKKTAQLVKELDPDFCSVSGPFYREAHDDLIMKVFVSR